MTTVSIEVDEDLHAAISRCIAERDAGMAQAEASEFTTWNKRLIDQAIDVFAATGQQFSANDLRPLLPDVPGPLMGARFAAAQLDGRIRFRGWTRSTKPNTHGKPVTVWIGVPADPA